MSRRAQLVLAAAIVVTAALVPMLVAYLQLGYPVDAAAERADAPGVEEARGDLDRATYRAATEVVEGNVSTASAAATTVGEHVDRVAEGLSARGAAHDRVYRIAGNGSAATAFARGECPGGERRRFGPCRAVGGVVLQRRVGVWTVVAVAVDLRIDGPDERIRATFVLRPYR